MVTEDQEQDKLIERLAKRLVELTGKHETNTNIQDILLDVRETMDRCKVI